ncbi:MAG: hypothetical protein M1840_004493 [Geoglossum simile]|nr:MAG: hypothetical protein M1840_004493 [Geoglossum simile]
MSRPITARYSAARPAVLSIAKLLFALVANLPFLRASPLSAPSASSASPTFPFAAGEGKPPEDPRLWIYLSTAVALVLLGGAFAGLTIALMGQDEIHLQVIRTSGDGSEKKHAGTVLHLLQRGKHWVLVTLLLSNVITNETLPIVLDRSLGGGWPAVLSSTVLIVIFGEIIPQSICVRYGLPIGAYLAPVVLTLMYILAPVAYPTARLLDYLLGEDHGTMYKKAGLKTLVTLHKSLGTSPSERLNQDEVTIITAVLDLKDKPVGSIMTPMDNVFTMSGDTVLDEQTMDIILSAGYSRIPIHASDNKHNFIGMLLVKILITYDPEDGKRVSDFALATLPETRPETSCLDIVNFFQEGKSHMVLVSDYPGENYGALGVVTLEDVIEELIGEEIIDESDVFIDVRKAIRRIAPAPKARIPKGAVAVEADGRATTEGSLVDILEDYQAGGRLTRTRSAEVAQATDNISAPPAPSSDYGVSPINKFRRSSSGAGNHGPLSIPPQPIAGAISSEIMAHFKHLGPSNLASKPKQTRYNTVKIKPGSKDESARLPQDPAEGASRKKLHPSHAGMEVNLGRTAGSETTQTLQAGHREVGRHGPEMASHSTQTSAKAMTHPHHGTYGSLAANCGSYSTLGSLPSRHSSRSPNRHKGVARWGSISESVIDVGGVRKVVLETTSSSEDADESTAMASGNATNKPPSRQIENIDHNDTNDRHEQKTGQSVSSSKKKRRRKRKKADEGETVPLLEGGAGSF